MSELDQDVATVRGAALAAKGAYDAEGDPIAALDRLVARLQEAERELDEALHDFGYSERRHKLVARAEAAEAREAALRETLEYITNDRVLGVTDMKDAALKVLSEE